MAASTCSPAAERCSGLEQFQHGAQGKKVFQELSLRTPGLARGICFLSTPLISRSLASLVMTILWRARLPVTKDAPKRKIQQNLCAPLCLCGELASPF